MLDNVPEKVAGPYRIRLMRDEDAPGVVELYRHVYGDSYPVKDVYNANHLIDEQKQGLAYRVVTVDDMGNVVAHQSLYRMPRGYEGLYENGQGMVHPSCRGRNIFADMFAFLAMEVAEGMNIEEQWGEGVCNHTMSQKGALLLGAQEYGIEIDLMPAAAYGGGESGGRVGVVVGSKPIVEKDHDIFLPARYDDILRRIYTKAGRQRRLQPGDAGLPRNCATESWLQFVEEAGIVRVHIVEGGTDLQEHLQKIWDEHIDKGATVLQAIMRLDQPWSGAVANILNRQGFFFGAVMPRWFDGDGLLLQQLRHEPDYDAMQLYSDFARELLEYIRRDRERVMNGL